MAKLVAMIIIMVLFACGLLVAGIYLLVGLAWSLIAVSALLFSGAILLRKGVADV